ELRNEILDNSKKTLRAIVIDGAPGFGKTRLIEELRIRCVMTPVDFAVCCCTAEDLFLQQIATAVDHLLRSRDDYKSIVGGDMENVLIRLYGCGENPSSPDYPLGRTISDLVGLFGTIARLHRIVLVLEDVHFATGAVYRFLEQICLRAAELP